MLKVPGSILAFAKKSFQLHNIFLSSDTFQAKKDRPAPRSVEKVYHSGLKSTVVALSLSDFSKFL